VDREKVKRLDVPLQSVFTTLGASLGPAYINDFNLFDRTWRVYVQAEGRFRSRAEDITRLEVRNNQGQMLPLGSVLEVRSDFGPDKVYRYNLYPAALMSGNPAPGRSSGEALTAMDSLLARTLSPGVGFEWTAMAYQQKAVSGQGGIVFILALVVVYLILAALYENWLTPLAVIFSIPLAVLGAMLGLMLRGMDNNIYTQVGLVLLVGLGAKNAILIVEFARANRIAGMGLIDSAVEAARLRLRPILMTAFAFILGVLPLVIATGAGAASRQAIGTAVFFGMIGNTFLGLLFTPVLFVAVTAVAEKIFGRQKPDEPLVIETAAPPLAAPAH
jgi:HAE1 family hydrophobic/amphiphilic exporter-1